MGWPAGFRILPAVLLWGLWGPLGPVVAWAEEAAPNATGTAPAGGQERSLDDPEGILGQDIEQLARTPVVVPAMDIPVTSVTKEPSTVGRSAAAVFVITNEMIRRSGATNIPEALRMAPGVHVAQINANTWSVNIRGFGFGPYSNKLLVLVDGRTVYNPDFAGVFWNVQDILLEDVERIEVIRGPGGTLWGANAVNGVINIITKEAKNSQGVYAMAGGGNQLRDVEAFRYGDALSDDCQFRIYGKHFEQAANFDPGLNYAPASDAWRQGRTGFRVDWQPGRSQDDFVTIQGDHYVGETDNSIIPTSPYLSDYLTGDNLLTRWRHVNRDDSDWTVQLYYDSYMRSDLLQTQVDKTIDFDFQYHFPLGERHQITCGVGFRSVGSTFVGGDTFTQYFPTPYCNTNYPSQFLQDEIGLIPDELILTTGCKLEENPYTGLQYQPTIRLLWAPDKRHAVWGAISRAVHTPTRLEEEISFTGTHFYPAFYQRAIGSTALTSEAVVAYELGYRAQTTERFSWDVATFYNVCDSIIAPDRVLAPFVENWPLPPHVVLPTVYQNQLSGVTYGAEFSAAYAVSKRWRLQGQYTAFQMELENNPNGYFERWDPQNLLCMQSFWTLREDLDFDLTGRYVDRLVLLEIPGYVTMDARLAWRPRKNLELALVGQNLLQPHHREYFALGMIYETEVSRSVYGTATWRY